MGKVYSWDWHAMLNCWCRRSLYHQQLTLQKAITRQPPAENSPPMHACAFRVVWLQVSNRRRVHAV